MHVVSFIVAFLFILVAAFIFGRGLVRLYQDSPRAQGLISSGFMVGVLGVLIATIIFGFFSL